MEESEFRKSLDHKFVIFDTNIFIKAFDHFESFKKLLDFLRSYSCTGLCFPLVEFEFLNGRFTPEHLQEREKFLELVAGVNLPIKDSLIEEAVQIARIYAYKKIGEKQISLIDCCLAAYLKQYDSSLYLITLNHKDFPLILFDRLFIFPLEDQNEVFVPAFYKFNKAKWVGLKANLDKLK